MKAPTYAQIIRQYIKNGWHRPRWQHINVTRKHRCCCRGYVHQIFGTQHECLNMVWGSQRKLYCSSCPCSNNVPRFIAVIP